MLIDVNASFGGRESIQRFDAESMLDQLRRTPCHRAFVHCRQGLSDAVSANDQTFALCRDHSWLRPVGIIHPRDTFTWQSEVERCLAAGGRLFRINPGYGGWSADSIFLDDIATRLAGTGAALLVDATMPGLPTVVAERTAEAGIPIIFTEARYYPLTELLPLMERYPHLFVETSRLTSPHAIELCVAAVGADRLIYGSGTARYPARVTWQTLERAAISDDDRAAIAWRNAAVLFGESSTATRTDTDVPRSTSWITTGMPIVDVHLHDKFTASPFPPLTPAAYEAELTRCGVTAGICSSVTSIFYDLKQGNDEVARLIDQVPRLRGYVVVDPRYLEDSVAELRRFANDDRFIGVKIHAAHAQTPTAAPEMHRLFATVAPFGKPILIHNLGADWPEALVALAQEFPHLPIIAAHTGYGDGPAPTHDAALRLASAANIYIEFCSTYLTTGAIRRGIDAVGVHRVLFGSDFPVISLPYMLTAYEDAALTLDETEQIFYRNIASIFPTLSSGIIADALRPLASAAQGDDELTGKADGWFDRSLEH
jgi:predicted TIM-barrel fold metal-dependent hydrolase